MSLQPVILIIRDPSTATLVDGSNIKDQKRVKSLASNILSADSLYICVCLCGSTPHIPKPSVSARPCPSPARPADACTYQWRKQPTEEASPELHPISTPTPTCSDHLSSTVFHRRSYGNPFSQKPLFAGSSPCENCSQLFNSSLCIAEDEQEEVDVCQFAPT